MTSGKGFQKIPVGISSCLLGESVRYNGGHKHEHYCTDVLADYFEFHGFCPEVAIGLGVPRESIRLVGEMDAPRAVGTATETLDVTLPLLDYAELMEQKVRDFSGYIWMKDSPSCGLFSAKVYRQPGHAPAKRAGLVANSLRGRLPLVPMEESGRLNDPGLRESFIARVFVYHEWRQLQAAGISPSGLVAFHSRHKFWVMSYGQALYRSLGQLVASAGSAAIGLVADAYISALMSGTAKPAKRSGHVNVLYHLVGYLKEVVPGGIRQELVQAIEEYRTKQIPLAVPMKMIRHYVDNYASDYIRSQTYLCPHPFALGLRNEI